MTTEDGAQAFMGWYDTVLEIECNMGVVAEDGTRRCLPMGNYVFNQGHFADSDCTRQLFSTGKLRDCPSFDVAWLTLQTSNNCGATTLSVYRDGHIYDETGVYIKSSDGSCTDMSSSYGRLQFLDSLGNKQSPEIFAEAVVDLVE